MVDFAQVISQVTATVKLTTVGYIIQLDFDNDMWSYM
jgi:hypothetical protein